jgi:predicted O-methyltransferase YrrM
VRAITKAAILAHRATRAHTAFRGGAVRAVALGLACADYWLRPGLKAQYGGPFNDQRARARLCEQLAAVGGVQAVVETGTYRGTTTLFLARLFGTPVHSVEINPRYHYYAWLRTRGVANIRLSLGDSRQFLQGLAHNPNVPKQDVFFYLDAHRPGNMPVCEELDLICRHWHQPLVMIDDVEVPGDPGYGFNDYGRGLRFGTESLSSAAQEFRHFYPATSSREETGYRRGCILLAPPGRWSERLGDLSLVREHERS